MSGPVPGVGPGDVVRVLREHGLTVATAESLTGGLVCAALTGVPGSSAVVRGAVVSYATDVKDTVLGVDPHLLARVGAVDGRVAAAMAEGVRRVLGADVGVSTTGVAGPDTADGRAVGTVFTAVAAPWGTALREHAFSGDRDAVRRASVAAALAQVNHCVLNLRDVAGPAGYGGATSEPTTREEAP